MKTKEELEKQQKQLVKEIKDHAKALGLSNDNLEPITDGVCSIDGYLKSNPKVMWILKEPYDDFEDGQPVGGGWSITEHCFGKREDVWSQRTWQPIIYIMYGYLHGMLWQDMDWIRDNKNMANVLKDIAYINISKTPGFPRSSWSKINQCYYLWKPILEKQLAVYSPNIIVCAGTFSHFSEDFIKQGIQLIDTVEGVVDVYKLGTRIIIDAYHPLQTQINRGLYVDSIIGMFIKHFHRPK